MAWPWEGSACLEALVGSGWGGGAVVTRTEVMRINGPFHVQLETLKNLEVRRWVG